MAFLDVVCRGVAGGRLGVAWGDGWVLGQYSSSSTSFNLPSDLLVLRTVGSLFIVPAVSLSSLHGDNISLFWSWWFLGALGRRGTASSW